MKNIHKDNTLVCIFSYNKGRELEISLSSLLDHMRGFPIILYDDGSTKPATLRVIDKYREHLSGVYFNTEVIKKKKCGGLYDNMQYCYEYALNNGYDYVFFMQDDIQIVRDFSDKILGEYSDIFRGNESIIQIDPRFVRKSCNVWIDSKNRTYCYPQDDYRRGYSDVGFTAVRRLQKYNWVFVDEERENKKIASDMGLLRVIPFTPCMMHVPFPHLYRGGKNITLCGKLMGRGNFAYKPWDNKTCKVFDSRPLSHIPYSKKYLKIKGFGLLRVVYLFASERNIYGGETIIRSFYSALRKIPFVKKLKEKLFNG